MQVGYIPYAKTMTRSGIDKMVQPPQQQGGQAAYTGVDVYGLIIQIWISMKIKHKH